MTIELSRFVDAVDPANTVLLFGAGSSIPSGAPSAADLQNHLSKTFSVPDRGFTLSEVATLVEQRYGRQTLIAAVREQLTRVKPTRGLLNLAIYPWKSLFTTNYDDLIEQCYQHRSQHLTVYSSNFDFTLHDNPLATKLFKLHGTVDKDVCDGHTSRLIITDADNDLTTDYREALYNRLKGDIVGSHLVIIGHALKDTDIREIANHVASFANRGSGAWKISLLLYEVDDNRAALFEPRGFTVCFGGIDDFFAALSGRLPRTAARKDTDDPLDATPVLHPSTLDVEHAFTLASNVSAMFNGWPATHADVRDGMTFDRTTASEIAHYLREPGFRLAVLLGASGVGKTTAARQALQLLRQEGFLCWEHITDNKLNYGAWTNLAGHLQSISKNGVLLIDEVHSNLQELNELVDQLVGHSLTNLRLIVISSRNLWNPRVKSPNVYKHGKDFLLSQLNSQEIERLLNLVDAKTEIRVLVEPIFSGFSRYERRRRLVIRCESETFACLKNIFASEKFDDIILREYATLPAAAQEAYRHVAAMESAGVRVHRQLVIRLLGIAAASIGALLQDLTDIVSEYTINEKEGIYGWRGRHPVIVAIVSKYKFNEPSSFGELISKVIDNISPTYEIEVRTIRELCNLDTGIPSIADKSLQNRLLRKMVSAVPGERVPRHRLIRNLVNMGEFEKADSEIR